MSWQVPGWLLDPLGPLTVRWRHAPRLLPFLTGLLRASTPSRVARIAAELATYLPHALDAYEPLLAESGLAHLVRRDGMMWVFPSDRAFAKGRDSIDLRRRYGIPVDVVPEAEIRQIEPALASRWRHAVLLPDVGRVLDPGGLVKGLADHFARRGGVIARGAVKGFEHGPDGPRAVVTDAGTLPADAVVIAAGAWSGSLAARLGSRVPLETERGYHITIPNPGVAPRRMIQPYGEGFLATPMAMGLRVAGTVELASLDAAPDWRRAEVLLAKAKSMFPGIDTSGASRWMGHRPSLPDSKPVIGRSPIHGNVFYAFGHGHLGLTGAATTGRHVADLVAGRQPAIDLRPFAIDRF
jgi:D-amino-acid dehydrogenase